MYAEDYLTACDSCYVYELPACPDSAGSFTIKGSLGNEQSREWYVEDKFGKVYHGTATTTAGGDIEIPLSGFPDGYFTQFSGQFVIYFKATEAATAVQDLTFNAVTYECIRLSFADISTTNLIIQ